MMKTSALYKNFYAAGLAAALSLGFATQASAVGIYQVTPSVLGGPATPFEANFVNGNSSSLLTLNAGLQTISGAGWVNLNSFALNNIAIAPGDSGLGVSYEMWATYSYTTQLISGTYAAPGSTYDVTSLHVDLWGAPTLGTSFTPANAATATAASVTPALGVQLLGEGDLINVPGLDNIAAFTTAGGTAFNSTTDFALTAFGSTFFTEPVPFYNIEFNEFNNTAQGVTRSGNLISINQASGGVDFVQVPEPVTLALLGIGLLGMRIVSRRYN